MANFHRAPYRRSVERYISEFSSDAFGAEPAEIGVVLADTDVWWFSIEIWSGLETRNT